MENGQDFPSSTVDVDEQSQQFNIDRADIPAASDTPQSNSVSSYIIMESEQGIPSVSVNDQAQQLGNGVANTPAASDTTQNNRISSCFTMENGQDITSVPVEDLFQQLDIGRADVPDASNTEQNDTVSASYMTLLVGGLHQDTGEQELLDHFGKYGEIEHIKVKINQATGRSRGFAFIVFKSNEALSKIHAAGDHVINGQIVGTQKAKFRNGKIFVGGLSSDLTDEEIKTHFAQFGAIVEIQMRFDKIKKQRKSFCFIVFEDEGVVKNLLRKRKQNIKGKKVDVKRAWTNRGSMRRDRRGKRGASGGIRVNVDYWIRRFNKITGQNFGVYRQACYYKAIVHRVNRGADNQRYQPY